MAATTLHTLFGRKPLQRRVFSMRDQVDLRSYTSQLSRLLHRILHWLSKVVFR